MLNGKYCGNCKYWINARATKAGNLPHYGTCAMGRPKKQGQLFRNTIGRGENRHTYMARHVDFTVRTDRCKDWSGNND